MERKLKFLVVFFSAFAIGVTAYGFSLLVALLWELEADALRKAPVERLEIVTEKPPTPDDFVAEFSDLPRDEDLVFPNFYERFFDFHNTDGLVRKSETVAKNGETWLVMFERNGKYEIQPSKARITQLRSISYAGDETDARVRFPGKGKPVLAFRNIKNIKPGPVDTVYLQPTWEEIDRRNLPIDSMKTGFKRELDLNGKWYTLRVSTGLTADGKKIGVLVLEHDGVQQVIARNYFEDGSGTIIGDLLWAGDIDGDEKLDLYFDNYSEKGGFSGGLYLSTHADEGEMLKLVALFGYGGC